jgi:sugar phosphate isomerase/epimerase
MWKWHPENDSQAAWDDLVQSMESALIAAERNNLILAFEPESENVVNSATRARKLLNELRNPRLRTVIDPANLISPGCNQQEIIDEAFALLGDSIVIAHAKDRDRNFQACAAGKGILDFEYYLRCAKQSGFTGPLVMHGLDEIDVAFAREFLRRALANVGFIS